MSERCVHEQHIQLINCVYKYVRIVISLYRELFPCQALLFPFWVCLRHVSVKSLAISLAMSKINSSRVTPDRII